MRVILWELIISHTMKKMKRQKIFKSTLNKISLFALSVGIIACSSDESTESKIKFTKQAEPVWEGVFTAADPSVIRDGDTLRMYYSSLVLDPEEKLVIAGAKSTDG